MYSILKLIALTIPMGLVRINRPFVVNILRNNLYLPCICCLLMSTLYTRGQGKKDTSNIYVKLEKKASEHRATRWVYDAIFEKPEEVDDTIPVVTNNKKTANPFLRYKGKVIRNISIVVLDPFGYSVNDLSRVNPNYVERRGNQLHATTRQRVIRNILLFKSDDAFDALEVSESERLIRQSPNINDARIYVQRLKGKKSDTVDIKVLVQDRWSTAINTNFSLRSPSLLYTERNIFGLGHEFVEGFNWSPDDRYINHTGSYSVFNIKNTFITSEAFDTTSKENKKFGASLNRIFYSPLAKWAGGIAFTTNFNTFQQIDPVTAEISRYALRYNTYDWWGAKSFLLSNTRLATLNNRSSNFIAGLRFYHANYLERPSFEIDTNLIHRNRNMVLVNVGFTHRSYYRDRFLYRFGANEDVPEGYSVEFINGFVKKEFTSLQYYSGFQLAAGQYMEKTGYFSGGIGFGTFYDKAKTSQGVVNFDALYFSDLIENGGWYFRQFAHCKIVHGFGRESYENINIDGTQMYSFSTSKVKGMPSLVSGTSKMVLNLEVVIYSPFKIIGFRFAPVVSCGLATIGNNFGSLFNSTVYQAFALGVLVRNEYLIINTFKLSIGFYPYMPGSSDGSLKINPIGNYTVAARDFFISKPDLIVYQ